MVNKKRQWKIFMPKMKKTRFTIFLHFFHIPKIREKYILSGRKMADKIFVYGNLPIES
jgi:hypothetical protein